LNSGMEVAEERSTSLATRENAAKLRVARLSIIAISLLIVIKAVGSALTGSIGIRADALHSLIDLGGVVIGFIGMKVSSKPPDERHTFGHGKAESIAAAVVAGLIFVAAGTIFYEAFKRLIAGGTVELVTVGIYITAAAIVINLAISWYALKIAGRADSVALEASARDMLADVLSSCAVLVGLFLVKLTGLNMLDPIVAIFVAVLIARTAYHTMKKAFGGLMDTRLPEAEEEVIRSCIIGYAGKVVSFHSLRTRKSGSQRYIDLHLVMPQDYGLPEAHDICDRLERDIERKLKRASLTIHVEPCTGDCDRCRLSCTTGGQSHQ